ncbi:MAG: diiron oxygenase [Acidimicrobiales bacterium]
MTTTLLPEADERIERLNTASARRYLDPDEAVPGHPGDGPVLPPELLSIAGLGLSLTDEQLTTLAREELASITEMGLRFEAVLMAGFCLQLSVATDLTDPRAVYALHEVGEETRHSRLFSRMLTDLKPTATNPMARGFLRRIQKFFEGEIIKRPALLDVLILSGEEIPDLFQKKAAEHPATDPFVKAVSKYHRQEEARHLAFARTTVVEHWARASRFERFLVRRIAPLVITDMFRMTVHPGVYETVGLPGWATWRKANKTPQRLGMRYEACRGVLTSLIGAGALRAGRIPRSWRRLCGVDRHGVALAST